MKPIWLSKTFWINLLTIVISVLETSGLTQMLPPDQQTNFLMGLAVLNIILRMITSKAVTLS